MKLISKTKERFSPELEKGYIAYYYKESLFLMRISLGLGVALYFIYGMLDMIMLSETLKIAWVIRFGIVIPVTLISLGLTFTKSFLRYGQSILLIAGLFLGFGIIVMLGFTHRGEQGYDFYFVGLTLVLIWMYTFSRMKFSYALIGGGIITAGYFIMEVAIRQRFQSGLFSKEGSVLINNMLLFLSCNIIGGVVSFSLGNFLRKVYRQKTIIKEKQEHLSVIMQKISDSSGTLFTTSSGLSETSGRLSDSSSHQEENVSTVITSLNSMEQSISGNTEISKETSRIAFSAVEKSQRGKEAVSETLKAMRDISRYTGKIEEISHQTNIVALNAAIEAARVGSLGKQFVVVAAEVRKLADVSRDSANEIKKLVESSVKISEQSELIFNDIMPQIEETAKLIDNIANDSTEHLSGINVINKDMEKINEITRSNAHLSTEISETAKNLNTHAKELKEVVLSVGEDNTRAIVGVLT